MNAANHPYIHVHINNQPLASTSKANLTNRPQRVLKRRNSSASDLGDNGDLEPLLLFGVLEDLHRKFPKLNFPQYSTVLETKGFVYAESVIDFDREYFIQLGFCEGAVGPFLSGVRKALERQKMPTKRARVDEAKESSL